MTHKMQITLDPMEVNALDEVAGDELRDIRQQARQLVREGLKQRGKLNKDDEQKELGKFTTLINGVVELAEALKVTPRRIVDVITKLPEETIASYDHAYDRIKNDGMSKKKAFELHLEEMQCWRDKIWASLVKWANTCDDKEHG